MDSMTKEQRYLRKQSQMGRRARKMLLTDAEAQYLRSVLKELREAEKSQQP